MGVKYFFSNVKNTYPQAFEKIHRKPGATVSKQHDSFGIDMNGIFHLCAQRVFKYGKFQRPKSLLQPDVDKPERITEEMCVKFYRDVCKEINFLTNIIKPKKTLILCVDGVAGYGKSYQQRQRRYKSVQDVKEVDTGIWSSVNLSVGTEYMHNLGLFIEEFIKFKIESDPYWAGLDVIWSSEKVPGEGEHKIINYIRNYLKPNESICIHGMDADLMMLGMATHHDRVSILRDDHSNDDWTYLIDIGKLSNGMKQSIDPKNRYKKSVVIDDFVFLCFLLGNDFLPNIPSVETIRNGTEVIITNLQQILYTMGPIINKTQKPLFNITHLGCFFKLMEQNEGYSLNDKINDRRRFYPDKLLEQNTTINKLTGKKSLNFTNYKKDYYKAKIGDDENVKNNCHKYFEGLEWVFKYYTIGMPCWRWVFHDLYAPFFSELDTHLKTYVSPHYKRTTPVDPFHQMLMIIPPQLSHLFPQQYKSLVDSNGLNHLFPNEIEYDLSGKYAEWEGIVKLPKYDVDGIEEFYNLNKEYISEEDTIRNSHCNSVMYKMDNGVKSFIVNL